MLKFVGSIAAAVTVSIVTVATAGAQPPSSAQAAPVKAPGTICQTVVSSEPGAKPYELCLTKAEWDAKKAADAKDPNRKVCRYEAATNSRFKSYKVCMTAAEWENQRQLERQAVERIQSSTCVIGAGC